jgi:hypothetical protein
MSVPATQETGGDLADGDFAVHTRWTTLASFPPVLAPEGAGRK